MYQESVSRKRKGGGRGRPCPPCRGLGCPQPLFFRRGRHESDTRIVTILKILGRRKRALESKESIESINTYFAELAHMLQTVSQAHLQQVLSLLEDAYYNGHRIFIIGNGGSAATASHFALDLAKNTITPGAPRLKAISLTDHVPLITAWSNDTAY